MTCTPEQMLARLDEHPDAYRQAREIERWYVARAMDREDEHLKDLEKRALTGKDEAARIELEEALAKRGDRHGVGVKEMPVWSRKELERIKERSGY